MKLLNRFKSKRRTWQRNFQYKDNYIYANNGSCSARMKNLKRDFVTQQNSTSDFNIQLMENCFERGVKRGILLMSKLDAEPLHRDENKIKISGLCFDVELLQKLLGIGESADVYESLKYPDKALIFVFPEIEILIMKWQCFIAPESRTCGHIEFKLEKT